MGKVEENIDARKHRKSTHLASADLDLMSGEGKPLIFTIEKAWYETDVDVSGKPKDGIFCTFKEPGFKPMFVNSTNCKSIANFARLNGFDNIECWKTGNWAGIMIELFVDRNVKLKGALTDGIRIMPVQPPLPLKVKPTFTTEMFDKAFTAKATIESIKKSYTVTPEIEKEYAGYTGK